VHDKRNAVLPAFPVLQTGPFPVGTEARCGEEVRQPSGAVRGFREGAAAITAHGHRPVRDDLGDRVQDRPYGPLAHGCARPETFKRPIRP